MNPFLSEIPISCKQENMLLTADVLYMLIHPLQVIRLNSKPDRFDKVTLVADIENYLFCC